MALSACMLLRRERFAREDALTIMELLMRDAHCFCYCKFFKLRLNVFFCCCCCEVWFLY